jgi:hypothetical protein
MERAIPRALIAQQADHAAQLWAKDSGAAEPPNPYDEHLQPEHFRCWACDFARYKVQHVAPDCEASA